MKYGILIFVFVVSAQLYGQSARMGAGAFQAYNQYVISSHASVASTSDISITTTLPSTEPASFLVPAVKGVVPESSCDVVVQEELVAGRMIESGGNNNGINNIINTIKQLFGLRKSAK